MSISLITTDTLNAAIYTMRFYSEMMCKRTLTEPEFMAYQKICAFVEIIFQTAANNVMVDGCPVHHNDQDVMDDIVERTPEAIPLPSKTSLLMEFAKYCMAEEIDNIPSIARKSLFPQGDFIPVHMLYGTLQDHLYRNYPTNDLIVEFDRVSQEVRFTWRGETVEIKRPSD